MQGLWRTIAKCIERGIADITESADNRKWKQLMGHGKPNIRVTKVPFNIQDRHTINPTDDAEDSLMKHATGEGKDSSTDSRRRQPDFQPRLNHTLLDRALINQSRNSTTSTKR